MKTAIVIGSGFAGMSAASFMAKAGWHVTVLEKNDSPGGRGRKFDAQGFVFDMGPSWYWMPDVFERYFAQFGKKVSDYYELIRLDPSYRVYWDNEYWDIPADYKSLQKLFESVEPGSGPKLDLFLKEALYKYKTGMLKLVHKPGRSLTEFADWDVIRGVFRLDIFSNMKKHVARYFKHPRLQQLMEFPVLFLGALPQHTPALYSLMNYADICGGTWYPKGGMHKIGEAMHALAVELGVQFNFNHPVTRIETDARTATYVHFLDDKGHEQKQRADVVISGADYQFTESRLLDASQRSYSDSYWEKRTMAPSCLLYYVGLNKKLKSVLHHSLFFDTDFAVHGNEIYTKPEWPQDPLFYVSATSVTDSTTAPKGCENLFFLIPVAAGLTGDSETLRAAYFEKICTRFEQKTGESIKENIVYMRSYSIADFKNDYHSFKGNAYGLANTLQQTALLKPVCQSKKIKNLFYTGQLTVPGPGVPPSLISGEVVSKEVVKQF